MNGTIQADEPVAIAGTVFGNVLVSNHDVTVESGAHVEGAITGRRIIVRGHSSGRLIAREIVRLQRTARVKADVAAPKLALEDGALFSGTVVHARTDAALLVAAYRGNGGWQRRLPSRDVRSEPAEPVRRPARRVLHATARDLVRS